MNFRRKWSNEDLRETLTIIQNTPGSTWTEKAKATRETMSPFESNVFPAFMNLVAKKQRWTALPDITEFYMQQVYRAQSIEPVLVKSAEKLSEDQAESIKEKMKAKLGVSDIKLVTETDGSLVSGMTLAWGFQDPDNLKCPTQGLDLSFAKVLEKAALKEGVVIA